MSTNGPSGRHSNGLTPPSSVGRHNEFRKGPTFFRSAKKWWRDDGNGNQSEATDLTPPGIRVQVKDGMPYMTVPRTVMRGINDDLVCGSAAAFVPPWMDMSYRDE